MDDAKTLVVSKWISNGEIVVHGSLVGMAANPYNNRNGSGDPSIASGNGGGQNQNGGRVGTTNVDNGFDYDGLFNFTGNFNDGVLNTAGVVWGGAEIAGQYVRQNNGAKEIGRFLGAGTQHTARALTGTVQTISKIGAKAGTAGYLFSVGTYSNALLGNEKVSVATHVNFGVTSTLVAAAYFAAGTAAAPWVAGAALVYGALQMGSYAYNGQSLEQYSIGR